jgi:hypothetical protein
MVQWLRRSKFNRFAVKGFKRFAVKGFNRFAIKRFNRFAVQWLRCSRVKCFAVQGRWRSLFELVKIIVLAVLNHFKFEQP